jgi:hypothetical protein
MLAHTKTGSQPAVLTHKKGHRKVTLTVIPALKICIVEVEAHMIYRDCCKHPIAYRRP